MQELIAALRTRLWWLRGVAAALALLGLVPSLLPIDRIESLRLTYALILSWQNVADLIGSAIGRLPFLPELDANAINAIILLFTFMLPASIAIATAAHSEGDLYEMTSRTRKRLLRLLVHRSRRVETGFVAVFAFAEGIALSILANPSGSGVATMSALFIVSAGMAQISVQFPEYSKGMATMITAVATLQVLYLLNLPLVADFLTGYSCSITADC